MPAQSEALVPKEREVKTHGAAVSQAMPELSLI